jgi:hypothetical protein
MCFRSLGNSGNLAALSSWAAAAMGNIDAITMTYPYIHAAEQPRRGGDVWRSD